MLISSEPLNHTLCFRLSELMLSIVTEVTWLRSTSVISLTFGCHLELVLFLLLLAFPLIHEVTLLVVVRGYLKEPF